MKKYFIGSMAVIMAIAASAFTTRSNKATGDQFGNTGSGYEKLSSAYNTTNCTSAPSDTCGYEVTSAGAIHITGSSYTSNEMQTFRANGWVEPIEAKTGVYSE